MVIFSALFQGYTFGVLASDSQYATGESLADLVRIGLSINPDIRAETAKLEQTQTQIEIEEWAYWPSLEMSAGPAALNDDTFGYQVALSQTLYDWGNIASNVDLATEKYRQQLQTLLITRSKAALDIVNVYFDVYSARERLKVVTNYKRELDAIYRLAEQRVQDNFSDSSEISKVLKAKAYADEQLADIQGDFYEVEGLYQILLNRPSAPSSHYSFYNPNIFDYLKEPEILEEAIHRSPKYMEAQRDIAIAKAELKNTESTYKPKVVLQAKKLKNQRSTGGSLVDDSYVTIKFQMNFSDGLSSFQQSKAGVQKIDAAKWRLASVERELKRDFNSKYASRRALLQQQDALEEQISQADILIAAYKDQFIAGLRTIEDLINTESQKFQLQIQLLNTSLEYKKMPYETASSLGLLDKLFLNKGTLGFK
jgi:adhesin transport system outer membrane protein